MRTIVTSAGMLAEATTYATAHDMWKAAVKTIREALPRHSRGSSKTSQRKLFKFLVEIYAPLSIFLRHQIGSFSMKSITHVGYCNTNVLVAAPLLDNLGQFLANRFRLSPTRALITNVMENSAIAGGGQAPGERGTLAGGATGKIPKRCQSIGHVGEAAGDNF